LKRCRHHPDDDVRLAIDRDGPADDVRIAAVAPLPQPVAEHGDLGIDAVLVDAERPPDRRLAAEQRKQAG
jgi:hypothetical protein